MDLHFTQNNLVGNFSVSGDISRIDKTKSYVEKIDSVLYLVHSGDRYQLTPLDEDGKILVNEFHEGTPDKNPSIYELTINSDVLVINLAVYNSLQMVDLNSQSISIHLRRADENLMCSENGLKCGLKADSEDKIVDKLTEIFIRNRSIFVQENRKKKQLYEIYGKGYRAKMTHEHDGVYVIDRITRNNSKESVFAISQIYGNISFVLNYDALKIRGNGNTLIQTVETNEIFNAWERYMEFKETCYKEDIGDHIIPYSSLKVDGDKLIFTVSKSNSSLDDVKDVEFEFISGAVTNPVPLQPEEIRDYKGQYPSDPVFVRKMINEDSDDTKMVFKLPRSILPDGFDQYGGVLYPSDFPLILERRRRRKVLDVINTKSNQSANMIMRLSTKDVTDDQLGDDDKPLNSKVLKEMFGTTEISVKEDYQNAMSIALNTPDIALIQGPPGTGKSTLINGIAARLKEKNSNYRILVCAEQHEALYNIIDKMSGSESMPPNVTSKKEDGDDANEDRFLKNLKKFQNSCSEVCEEILNADDYKESFSSKMTSLISLIQEIRADDYSIKSILENSDRIEKLLFGMGSCDAAKLATNLRNTVADMGNSVQVTDPKTILLKKRIESQRLTLAAFEDDGPEMLRLLQDTLSAFGHTSDLMDQILMDEMLSGEVSRIESSMEEFAAYVGKLKEKYLPPAPSEFDQTNNKEDCLKDILAEARSLSDNRTMDIDDIIECFMFMLNDMNNIAEIVKNYTPVIGSTCAQAEKSTKYTQLNQNRYDFVIVDEAARANPLEIMIPLTLGARVLLVGDQQQLPHYIETEVVRRFAEEGENYSKFDEELLKKSLFQLIYDNLEEAHLNGKLKFKRTAMLTEQHRMNPVIGDFISNEFYGGRLTNGPSTHSKINDYGVFDGKNVVYLDLPMFVVNDGERKSGTSWWRRSEVDKTIETIRKIIVNNGEDADIGVITFYNGQVEALKKEISKNFSEDVVSGISIGTVDSFQGKEFDVVIINGVRTDTRSKLNFMTDSRVNVALSRARKLLIFIGDCTIFNRNEHFHNFFEYVRENGYHE